MSDDESATEDGVTLEADDPDGSDDGAADERGETETETKTEPDEELVERVAEADAADAAEIAREMATLRDRVDELESRLKRKQADFQNYKKRQERRREREKRRATEDLVERLLDVRDNLVRALDTDEEADIRSGIEKTLDQFDRVLDTEDVETIAPGPGTEIDPERHEVLMRVESDRPEGTVAEAHRPGYEMAERVLRPAQVTVSEGPGEERSREGEDSDDDGGDR